MFAPSKVDQAVEALEGTLAERIGAASVIKVKAREIE